MSDDIIITTTTSIEGKVIKGYLGIAHGAAYMTKTSSENLRDVYDAQKSALDQLMKHATVAGANAVIDLKYEHTIYETRKSPAEFAGNPNDYSCNNVLVTVTGTLLEVG